MLIKGHKCIPPVSDNIGHRPLIKVVICLDTYRAFNEVPRKMSLTADELKSRAQPLTNTDLEIKQGELMVLL